MSTDVHPYTNEELMARVEEAEADIEAGRFRTEDEMEAFMDRALEELEAHSMTLDEMHERLVENIKKRFAVRALCKL